ncbi:hypothetical protein O4273_26620 [Rhodococcus ruber]|uniref:hypothetical protein n=1 Tax=Rhodococcus ruber TaxID=1830 RepID=UPI0022B4CAC4|nr:hypothetical protein [Rhodococcus ruber]MCZ4506404.1 hypothetical protein [Rhodococcus ruber]
MRLYFTLTSTGGEHGTFEAWHEDGRQFVKVVTHSTGVETTVTYPTVPLGDKWSFIALALRDVELQAIRDRLEATQRALAATVHAS